MRADYDELVMAARSGDPQAYAELVNETSSLVSSIALSILRDVEMSRDIAQDVFLAVWRDLKNLRNPASFLPWLRQTTRNRAHEALRSVVRRRKVGETGKLDDLLPRMMDARRSVVDELVAREEARALAEALDALPEETREILTLFYREGQSVTHVAALLELSEMVVKKRLSRARERLRSSVQQQIGETLCRTRPDSGFTAVIIAALPSASAPATVAGIGAASKAGAIGIIKLLAPASGVLAGALGGVAGVVLGSRKWFRDAQDEQERLALRRHRAVSIAAVIFWAVMLPMLYLATRNRWVAIGWFLCFIATLAVLQHIWLPRIVRRRMAAEMRADPQQAVVRRRRERRHAILGWSLGIIFGSLGLAIGLWFGR